MVKTLRQAELVRVGDLVAELGYELDRWPQADSSTTSAAPAAVKLIAFAVVHNLVAQQLLPPKAQDVFGRRDGECLRFVGNFRRRERRIQIISIERVSCRPDDEPFPQMGDLAEPTTFLSLGIGILGHEVWLGVRLYETPVEQRSTGFAILWPGIWLLYSLQRDAIRDGCASLPFFDRLQRLLPVAVDINCGKYDLASQRDHPSRELVQGSPSAPVEWRWE